MSKPRQLSKLLATASDIATIATDEEVVSVANSASAHALSEAINYTDNELSSIDLTETINTASAAAFSSASGYTDTQIEGIDLTPYLTVENASAQYLPIDALLTIPYSASSPSDPEIGDLWIDSSANHAILHIWNGGEWKQEGSPLAPIVDSVNPNSINGSPGNELSVTGSHFRSGLYVLFIGSDNVAKASTQTVWYNSASAIATTPALNASAAPYDVRVVNSDGSFGELLDSLYTGDVPVWDTASGQIAIGIEGTSFSASVQASDPDLQTISYSTKFGYSLPSGVSLNENTGVISGTFPSVIEDTTFSFIVIAEDTSGNYSERLFNIVSQATNYFGDGSDGDVII